MLDISNKCFVCFNKAMIVYFTLPLYGVCVNIYIQQESNNVCYTFFLYESDRFLKKASSTARHDCVYM